MTFAEFKKAKLPDSPGVYFFKGVHGEILYIGRATSLSDRVRSYFTDDLKRTRGMKVFTMVTLAKTVTFKKTDSVLEAIFLERELIKENNPPYNTDEKDDKSYNMVVITKEKFPRVLVVRQKDLAGKADILKYKIDSSFGPFPSGGLLKEAMKTVRKIFPFRDTCTPLCGRRCFRAELHLCPGVCSGEISAVDYKKSIRHLKNFFEGNTKKIHSSIVREMKSAAKEKRFEEAARLKKILFSLDHIRDVSLIKDTDREEPAQSVRVEAFDIAHLSGKNRVGVMVALVNGVPKKDLYRTFKIHQDKNDDTGGLRELLNRRFSHPEWGMPDIIVVDGGNAQLNVAKSVLSGVGAPKIVSVVKDERHKPRGILGEKPAVDNFERTVLLSNAEAHRFAIGYHKRLRNKSFLR